MNIFFVMSISGSIVFFLYLLMKPFSNRFLSASWQYNFLKICLLFYLVPYQFLQKKYFTLYNALLGSEDAASSLHSGILSFKDYNTIYVSSDGRIHYKYGLPLFVFLSVWLGAIAFMLYRQLKKYRSCRSNLLLLSETADTSPESLTATTQYSGITPPNAKSVKQIVICPFIKSPITIGLFHPRIILPKEDSPKNLTLYLSHELSHIKSHDAMWKFTAFLAILLHWYNPLVYVLFYELDTVCEKHCDEIVTKPLSDSQKLYYENLIINAAQNQTAVSSLFANTFSTNKKQTKERILFMTRKISKFTHHKLITALLMGLVILSMPISVLAYEPVNVYHDRQPYKPNETMMEIILNDTQSSLISDSTSTQLDFTLSDEIFVDESGNQYVIDAGNEYSPRSCTHDYKNGSRYTHETSGSGCSVYVYEGSYCKKCGFCLQETFISKTTYAKCPH